MKHLLKIFAVLLISISLGFTNSEKKTVIIDVGHGGKDVGNISNGLTEKDLLLDIAQKLKSIDQNPNLEIILTRNSDKAISLKQRTALINSLDADLMLSLHLNAHSKPEKSGMEIFTSPKNKMFTGSNEMAAHLKRSLSTDYAVAEIKNANFMVLRDTDCPAVLLEMGFMTNPKERELLNSEKGREKLAAAIYKALE